MAIRKNKKRIDPRWFLSETTYRDEIEEGALGFGLAVRGAKQTADAMRNRKRSPSAGWAPSTEPYPARSYTMEGVSDEANKAFGEADAIVQSNGAPELDDALNSLTSNAIYFGQTGLSDVNLVTAVYGYNKNRKYLTDALPLLDDVIPLVAGVETERATTEDENRLLGMEPKDRLVVPTQLKYTE
jgi:hypothetical protein